MSDSLTNAAPPSTSATITLRIIKSFEYRTEKNIVLHSINLEQTTVRQLKDQGRQCIQTHSGWKPFRALHLDTLKIYTKAYGAKTSSLIINLDREDLILDNDDAYLAELGIENETEISFFNREAYVTFRANPETKWA